MDIIKRIIKKEYSNRGIVAIAALLIICSLGLVITFSVNSILLSKRQINKNLLSSAQSYYASESGIEDAVLRILKNYTYTSINNFSLGSASIDQNINTSGNITIIDSKSTYSSGVRKLRTSLKITTTNVSFYYGVQVGEGGMQMGNNSQINGNIYSDGSIEGGTSSVITGDAIVATGMALDANNINHDDHDTERVFGKKNDSVIDIAMKFIPAASGNLSQVEFYLKSTASSPGDGTIYLTEDNGSGSPKTTWLASTQLIASRVGTSYDWIKYSFSSPYSVTTGNTYWIVIDVNESNSTSKYFSIGQDSDNTDISKYSSNWTSQPWITDSAGKYAFKAWIGGLATYLKKVEVGGNARSNTIENSTITGGAYYQTIISSTAGNYHPGEPDPPVVAMPLSDSNIADWKSVATAAGNLSSSLCTASGTITLEAGILDCDFHPAGGSAIILNGTVWVKGDIIFDTNTKMKLSTNYGTRSGVIIAEDPVDSAKGKITIGNNAPICGTAGYTTSPLQCNPSNGTYILLLSTHTGYADNAISISNNSNGAIYYAHNGQASVSNGANVKEVTAKRLILQPTAQVTYESGLASASFSNGPGGGWELTNWNETQ